MSWPRTLITFHHVKRPQAPKLIARSPSRQGLLTGDAHEPLRGSGLSPGNSRTRAMASPSAEYGRKNSVPTVVFSDWARQGRVLGEKVRPRLDIAGAPEAGAETRP